jgi:predicted MFS family arabinose efflux permease
MDNHSRVQLPSVFRRLAWSNLAAQSAEQLGLAASPIVAVILLGASAGETGWLLTAQTLPFLLFAIPAGILADRMSRARLMACAEALRVVSLLAILALAAFSMLTLPLLALLGFLGACGTITYSVAAPALVPALVPAERLAAANARIELARTIAFAFGPALAGALIGWIGSAPAFGLAAALSAGAALLLFGMREPARQAAPSRRPVDDVFGGAAFVFRHPLLLPIFLTQLVFNTAFFVLQAVYVPYAVARLGLSASEIGATLAAYGLGMVAGAMLAARVARALPAGATILLGPIAGFVAALLMVLTIWVPSFGLAAVSFFLIGTGTIVWVVSTTTLRQTVTPAHLLGRVSAINILAYGARPIGAAIGALVGTLYGAEVCLLVAAAGFLVQLGMIIASPIVRPLYREPEGGGGRSKATRSA